MTEADEQINNIGTREVNPKYGEVKKLTTQQLYRNYKKWMEDKNPGVAIMPFKHWIKWAKDKGVVKNFAADAADHEKEDEKVTKIVNRSGKTVAVVMILLGVGFLAMNFIKFNSAVNNNNQQLKK